LVWQTEAEDRYSEPTFTLLSNSVAAPRSRHLVEPRRASADSLDEVAIRTPVRYNRPDVHPTERGRPGPMRCARLSFRLATRAGEALYHRALAGQRARAGPQRGARESTATGTLTAQCRCPLFQERRSGLL
jgi:hypothetical protein